MSPTRAALALTLGLIIPITIILVGLYLLAVNLGL